MSPVVVDVSSEAASCGTSKLRTRISPLLGPFNRAIVLFLSASRIIGSQTKINISLVLQLMEYNPHDTGMYVFTRSSFLVYSH